MILGSAHFKGCVLNMSLTSFGGWDQDTNVNNTEFSVYAAPSFLQLLTEIQTMHRHLDTMLVVALEISRELQPSLGRNAEAFKLCVIS